jgi:hypothetical protein
MPEPSTLTANPWRQGLGLALLVPSFYLAEWLLAAGTVATYSFLKFKGIDSRYVWLLFWGANMLVSAGFIFCNDRLRVDITLMQSLRKLVAATLRRSRCLGLLLEALLFLRLLIWDGPCQLLIFFRPRLSSRTFRFGLFVTASGLQMLVWINIFDLGYESVSELLHYLKG